jgi:ATP-dependent exoDNAse (exonuclease V) alpha subunit
VREAIGNIRDGNIGAALKAYKEHGLIDSESKTREDAMKKLIESWKEQGVENPKDNLIIAQTNAEVDRLNALGQEARKAQGKLGWKYLEVGKEKFHAGDRIIFTERERDLGIFKSEFANVIDVDVVRRTMTVQVDGREKLVSFSIDKFDGVRLGMSVTTHRSQSMTIDQDVFILAGGSMQSLEMSVVQFSRARSNSRIFIDRETAGGPELKNLEQQMKRSHEKTSAHAIAREIQLEHHHHLSL